MTAEEFVLEFKELKNSLEHLYFSEKSSVSRIPEMIQSGMNQQQINLVQAILSDALTDSMYTILLGLAGEGAIGTQQVSYQLADESGKSLNGDIESVAWEQFHGE